MGGKGAGIDHVALTRREFRSPLPQKAECAATSSFQKWPTWQTPSNHGAKIQNLPALHDLQGTAILNLQSITNLRKASHHNFHVL